MREYFNSILRKAFDIRSGEFLRAFLMQANIFLIISTLLIVKPTANGLFISEMGVKSLPLAFVFVSIFAISLSIFQSRFLGRTPLNRIIIWTFTTSIFLFILFGVLLQNDFIGGWLLYAFYVWVAIYAVLCASQFWIFANVVFDAREAKRLFGFIGIGAIAGGIFGGYATSLLARWIGSENMIFVGAFLLSLCIPIVNYVWKNHVLPVQSVFERRKKIPKRESRTISLIKESPHLLNLAGIVGVSVLVAKLVDYQFSAIAASKITDPDELTAFFGLWFSNFNLISLTIQLFLTRRIVGRLGVGSSLFILPMLVLIGASVIFFVPELWAAIFIKMGDGSLKQSINKSAVELLSLPIPNKIKNQTKTFIDVVVDSLATGFGGILLIFVVNGFNLSTRFISLMIIALILFWLYLLRRVKRSYLSAFKSNLKSVNNKDVMTLDLQNESVLKDIKIVLKEGDEAQLLKILKKLTDQLETRLAPEVAQLINHSSAAVVEKAIQNLYYVTNYNFSTEVTQQIAHPNQDVTIAAFEYLLAHDGDQLLSKIPEYLNDNDHQIRIAALLSLAEESKNNSILAEKFKLIERMENMILNLDSISDPAIKKQELIGLLKIIGRANIPAFFPKLTECFNHDDSDVVNEAISAAGYTLQPSYIAFLIDFLQNPVHRKSAQEALAFYGNEIIPRLENYYNTSFQAVEVLSGFPGVLQHLDTQTSVDFLFEMMQSSSEEIKLAAVRSLNFLKIKRPHLNFYEKKVLNLILADANLYQDTLSILYVQNNRIDKKNDTLLASQEARTELIELLEERLDANLERIFGLLGLKYPPDDVLFIYENIRSEQQQMRVTALEYLDNLLDPGLKKILIPIIETALLDAISEDTIKELNVSLPEEQECYRLLLERDDEELESAVQKLMQKQQSL